MSSLKLKSSKLTEKMKKLDNQLSSPTDDVFPQRTGILYLVVARKGSGKSTIVLNLLKTKPEYGGYRGFFDNIYLVNPNGADAKYGKLIKELDKTGNYYEEMNNDVLAEIEDKIKYFNANFNMEEEGRKPASLIILDDCLQWLPKSNQKNQIFHKLITGMRHLHCSMIISSQKLKGLNTIVRANTDIASFWRTDVQSEKKDIMDEFGVPEEYLNEAWKTPHSFLTVSFTKGTPEYFIKFDKIEN